MLIHSSKKTLFKRLQKSQIPCLGTIVHGFLSVDAVTGEEHLVLHESSKSEDIAIYFLLLCAETIDLGYSALIIF